MPTPKKKADVKAEKPKVASKPAEERRKAPKAPEAEAPVKEPVAAKTSVPEPSPGEEKPTTEEVTAAPETPVKAEKPAEPELTKEEREQLSERAQKRYRKLSEKARIAEEKAKKLEDEIEKSRDSQQQRFTRGIQPLPLGTEEQPPTPAVSQEKPSEAPTPGTLPAAPAPTGEPVPAGQERIITEEEYRRDVIRNADYIVRARLAQYAKAEEIKDDLKDVEGKYPELNPDSSDYSEEMSNKLSGLFNVQLQANPQARLKPFVNDIMTMRKSGEEKGKAEVSAKVVEQKAEEAVTPSEVAPPAEQSFETMTLEEKEAYMKEHGLW